MVKKIIALAFLLSFIIAILAKHTIALEPESNRKEPNMNDDIKITIIYDNNPCIDGLKTAWGFSCLIEGIEKTILFDTGGDGAILMANMDKLNINPEDIDLIVLSHAHWDHVGGLSSFLKRNNNAAVYMLKSFPDDLKNEAKTLGATIVEVTEPQQICKNVYSTGEMIGKIEEHSLLIQTDKGVIVITGCAHPGIIQIIEAAKTQRQDDVILALGGFHLVDSDIEEIDYIVKKFQIMDVEYAVPCHCTGETAIEMFEKSYQEKYIDIGTGKELAIRNLVK